MEDNLITTKEVGDYRIKVDDYLSPTTLEEIAEEIKKKVNRG